MRKIEALFADYAAYHQTSGNKIFHRIGIPLIMIGLFSIFERVDVLRAGGIEWDAAMLLIAAVAAWYFTIEWKLALLMIAVTVAFYFAGAMMPVWLGVSLFVLGWILQFVGHSVYEKKKPAFLGNLVHLLIGPLWLLNDIVPVVKQTPNR